MGLCATYIARLLEKQHWIAYVGLLVIFYVSVQMIADGIAQILILTA
jgi:predicted tellurium resistance membrane protein TerC